MLPLTDGVIFNDISTRSINDYLSSLVSERTQRGTLGSRDGRAIDCHPFPPVTAETVTVSEEMGKRRKPTKDAVAWKLACNSAESGTGENN